MTTALRHKIIGVAAAAVVSGMLGVASSAAAAPPTRSADPPTGFEGAVLSLSSSGLATLEEAVAAGRLDRELVVRLRSRGSVAGLVTFDQQSLLDRATRRAPLGKLRAAAVLSQVLPALRAQKVRALRHVDGEFNVLHQFRNLALSYVRFDSEAALLDTVNAPGVSGVRLNRPQRAELSSSLRQINSPQVSASGATGAGTYVAVLDSGVDYTHAAFGCTAPGVPAECRVAAVHEIAPDDGKLDDTDHGTNVAGIVAGVAPSTRLIVDDIFKADGRTDAVLISKAIDGLVQLKQQGVNIRAVNLSLGDSRYFKKSCPQSPFRPSFDLLRSVGILPVVAAGNDAYDARHRFHVGIASPACVPGAISVGAVYNKSRRNMDWSECKDRRARVDQIVCFSQTGRPLTMLAPGAVITAAGVKMSGTSQAAPHVSGAVAVLAAVNPVASIDQIRIALATTGKPIRDKRSKLTRRRLDLAAAVAAIGVPPTPPPPPTDRTPPSLSGPNQSIPLGWSLGSSGATPVEVSWQGSDASGIARYRLYVSVNNGSQFELTLGSPTATGITLNDLQPGSSYQFTVTAQDGAGNVGTSTGPKFTVGLWQESSQHITYSTGWQLLAWAQSLGGYHAGTSNTGSWASFQFTGRAIAWVAPASSLNGEAHVWLDNVYLGTVNGYSATTTPRKVIFSRNVPHGTHTLQVQAVGTQGHPQIDIDAFDVLH